MTPTPLLPNAFPQSPLLLGRLLPQAPCRISGLRASFAELERLAAHLESLGLDGYLGFFEDSTSKTIEDGVIPNDLVGVILVFEGRFVTASATSDSRVVWAETALAELTRRYGLGARLDFHGLDRPLVHALTGVADRSWQVKPGESFSGTRILFDGQASLYAGGKVIGRIDAQGSAGAFPAPLRPIALAMPRMIGEWAGVYYELTLRGQDAANPITDIHARTRQSHGAAAVLVLSQLGRGATPLEAGKNGGFEMNELERLVNTFVRDGFLRKK
jgi:hypothetical protein